MSLKGYSAAGSVAAYLNTTFNAAGSAEANAALAAAEEFIDDYTGRAWLTGAVTAERVPLDGPSVYLRNTPVASVQTVTGRYYGSTALATLVADTNYEVADLNRGLLVLSGYGNGLDADGFPRTGHGYQYLQVSYTPGTAVPARVARAATILAAEGMRSYLTGGMQNAIERTAGDVTLRFDAATIAGSVSPEVKTLLDPLRRGLIA